MSRNQLSATEQPDPILNDKPAVWEVIINDLALYLSTPVRQALIKDMSDRDAWGRSKYKVPLQPFNGRDCLVDLYQEFLDATAYTMQYRLENPNDSSFTEIYYMLLDKLEFIREIILDRDGK